MKKNAVIGMVVTIVVLVIAAIFFKVPYQLDLVSQYLPTFLQNNNSTSVTWPALANQTQPSQTSFSDSTQNLPEFNGLSVSNSFKVYLFAENLQNPRDLVFSPTGQTILFSETGAGEIEAIRVSDRSKKTLLKNLQRPHGITFYEGKFFLAEEQQVSRYSWDEANQTLQLEKVLLQLPKGAQHFTRTLLFDPQGKLYIGIGSTCNACIEKDDRLAAVMTSDADGNTPRVFAKGLRNPTFLALNPETNQIWTSEMGRDFLGDDLPPDEINILRENANFGWPYCYGNKTVDETQADATQEFCNSTEPAVYQITAHSAPLGLQFISSPQFPAEWQGDALVAYHGSWNSTKPVGYKIVRLKVEGNIVTGEEDFITGFIDGRNVKSRPVDLEFDQQGNLYFSDDKSGKIFKVSKN